MKRFENVTEFGLMQLADMRTKEKDVSIRDRSAHTGQIGCLYRAVLTVDVGFIIVGRGLR